MVLEIDTAKRRVSLGLKQTMRNPWEVFAETHPEGTEVEGEVKNITEFGLFIGLDNDIDGMVHLSDLSWDVAAKRRSAEYRKGDMVKAVVTEVDTEKERISLSVKALDGDPFADAVAGVKRGSIVTVAVTAIEDGGIEVEYERHEVLHPPLRPVARPGRTAPRAVPGRVTRSMSASPTSTRRRAVWAFDQGARDRRGEGSGRTVRLVRLRAHRWAISWARRSRLPGRRRQSHWPPPGSRVPVTEHVEPALDPGGIGHPRHHQPQPEQAAGGGGKKVAQHQITPRTCLNSITDNPPARM
jgi:hypothetical protein